MDKRLSAPGCTESEATDFEYDKEGNVIKEETRRFLSCIDENGEFSIKPIPNDSKADKKDVTP